MKIKISVLLACISVISLTTMAQDESKESGGGLLQRMDNAIEKLKSRGIDTNYIQTPKEPWQISVKGRVAQTDLQMHSTIDGGAVYAPIMQGTGIDIVGPLLVRPRVTTPVSSSVGMQVGYKGLSASYMFPIGGNKGRSLSLRSIGRFHSIHFRWHQFEDKSPEVSGTINMKGLSPEAAGLLDFKLGDMDDATGAREYRFFDKWHLTSPIKIKTLVFDGFYIFNYKHFSYGAAYNQKTIQKRSAGSFIAGAMAYYADLRFNNSSNGELITYMGGIGRIRQWQGSVGGGYAYNFVPGKGWLISATVMPMVTFMNRMKMDQYSSDFVELAAQDMREHTIDEYYNSEDIVCTLKHEGAVTRNNRLTMNFTARMSVTYNWSRYFANVNGQFNNFQYRHKSTKNSMHGHLNDWYVNASVGVRL